MSSENDGHGPIRKGEEAQANFLLGSPSFKSNSSSSLKSPKSILRRESTGRDWISAGSLWQAVGTDAQARDSDDEEDAPCCGGFWNVVETRATAVTNICREHPVIIVATVATLVITMVGGLLACYYGYMAEVDGTRNLLELRGKDVAHVLSKEIGFLGGLLDLTAPALLALATSADSGPGTLEEAASSLVRSAGGGAVVRVLVAPGGVVRNITNLRPGAGDARDHEGPRVPIGASVLAAYPGLPSSGSRPSSPSSPPGRAHAAAGTVLVGPPLPGGNEHDAALAAELPASPAAGAHAPSDWVVVDLDLAPMLALASPLLAALESDGLAYELHAAAEYTSDGRVLARSAARLHYETDKPPGEVPIGLPGASWLLLISPRQEWSWHIIWVGPVAAVGFSFNLVFAALLFFGLVRQYQHQHLLRAMLPDKVIRRLSQGERYIERYETVTILFSDIVSYTSLAAQMSAEELVVMLNDVYSMFDEIVDQHGVYKVESVGDAFMVVGGAPHPCGAVEAANEVARFASAMLIAADNYSAINGQRIRIRVGVHSGPVVAGVVGMKMPRWCLFGDTVNTALKMESTGTPSSIHISETTRELLEQGDENWTFTSHPTDKIFVKGKGMVPTYFIDPPAAWRPPGLRRPSMAPGSSPTQPSRISSFRRSPSDPPPPTASSPSPSACRALPEEYAVVAAPAGSSSSTGFDIECPGPRDDEDGPATGGEEPAPVTPRADAAATASLSLSGRSPVPSPPRNAVAPVG